MSVISPWFNSPRSIVVYGDLLYVADQYNHAIRKIDIPARTVSTIAGFPGRRGLDDGIGMSARFNAPEGIETDGDYLYVADTGNNVFRRVNKFTGEVLTFSGKRGQASFSSGEREEARYNNVVSVATAPNSPYLFFTDSVENVIGQIEK